MVRGGHGGEGGIGALPGPCLWNSGQRLPAPCLRHSAGSPEPPQASARNSWQRKPREASGLAGILPSCPGFIPGNPGMGGRDPALLLPPPCLDPALPARWAGCLSHCSLFLVPAGSCSGSARTGGSTSRGSPAGSSSRCASSRSPAKRDRVSHGPGIHREAPGSPIPVGMRGWKREKPFLSSGEGLGLTFPALIGLGHAPHNHPCASSPREPLGPLHDPGGGPVADCHRADQRSVPVHPAVSPGWAAPGSFLWEEGVGCGALPLWQSPRGAGRMNPGVHTVPWKLPEHLWEERGGYGTPARWAAPMEGGQDPSPPSKAAPGGHIPPLAAREAAVRPPESPQGPFLSFFPRLGGINPALPGTPPR